MSKNSGLILETEEKGIIITSINLLIVKDGLGSIGEIIAVLEKIDTEITYTIVKRDSCIQKLSENRYNAIVYSYFDREKNSEKFSFSQEKLRWWYALHQKIPLILITDPLGEEIAIELIQSGINGYLLRKQIYKLPKILERVFATFFAAKKNAQLERIRNLEKQIESFKVDNERLQTLEDNKREYLSHLNHELRSPVATILQFSGMLKEEIYGSLNPKQMQYVSNILTTGEHLLELINDYLDIEKINANKEELYKEKIAVEEICQASLLMVREKARAKGLDLKHNIAEGIEYCFADKLRLKQILVNLLTNAVKFTKTGSVTLDVTQDSQTLNLAVIDTGIGISSEDEAKLFQPFQQINNPLQTHHKGTGLGLTLSKKLAQLHGGDIILTSELGSGSCFKVCIPLSINS